MDVVEFASVFSEMTKAYWLKLNRLCENLSAVGAVSAVHGWFALEVLGRLFLAYEEKPKDVHYLFSAFLTILLKWPLPMSPPLREALAGLKTSGKSAKLLKQVLDTAAEDEGALQAVHAQRIDARIARAERWAGAAMGRASNIETPPCWLN